MFSSLELCLLAAPQAPVGLVKVVAIPLHIKRTTFFIVENRGFCFFKTGTTLSNHPTSTKQGVEATVKTNKSYMNKNTVIV